MRAAQSRINGSWEENWQITFDSVNAAQAPEGWDVTIKAGFSAYSCYPDAPYGPDSARGMAIWEYRFLVIETEDGWRIDEAEELSTGEPFRYGVFLGWMEDTGLPLTSSAEVRLAGDALIAGLDELI